MASNIVFILLIIAVVGNDFCYCRSVENDLPDYKRALNALFRKGKAGNREEDKDRQKKPEGLSKLVKQLEELSEQLKNTEESRNEFRMSLDMDMDYTGPLFKPTMFMDLIQQELQPLPEFVIPPYFYYIVPPQVYDSIDYDANKEEIERIVSGLGTDEIPSPVRLNKTAAMLYRLQSGCAVDILQRLLSGGLQQWAMAGTSYLRNKYFDNNPQATDVDPRIFDSIMTQIVTAIHRTIFGNKFDTLIGMANFLQQAADKSDSESQDVPETIFLLTRYILQCPSRSTFLEGFLTRLEALRERVLNVEAWPFTTTILQSLEPNCRRPNRFHFRRMLEYVKPMLLEIQYDLREVMYSIVQAVVFDNDDTLEKFTIYLGDVGAGVMDKVLSRLRNEPSIPANPQPISLEPVDNGNRTDNVGRYASYTPIPPPNNFPQVTLNPARRIQSMNAEDIIPQINLQPSRRGPMGPEQELMNLLREYLSEE